MASKRSRPDAVDYELDDLFEEPLALDAPLPAARCGTDSPPASATVSPAVGDDKPVVKKEDGQHAIAASAQPSSLSQSVSTISACDRAQLPVMFAPPSIGSTSQLAPAPFRPTSNALQRSSLLAMFAPSLASEGNKRSRTGDGLLPSAPASMGTNEQRSRFLAAFRPSLTTLPPPTPPLSPPPVDPPGGATAAAPPKGSLLTQLRHPLIQMLSVAAALVIGVPVFDMAQAPLTMEYTIMAAVVSTILIVFGVSVACRVFLVLHIAGPGVYFTIYVTVRAITSSDRAPLIEEFEAAQHSVLGFHIMAFFGALFVALQPEAHLTDRMKVLVVALYLAARLPGFVVIGVHLDRQREAAEMYAVGDLVFYALPALAITWAVARRKAPRVQPCAT